MLHRSATQAPRGIWIVVAAALVLPALVQMFTGHEGLEPRGEALGWDVVLVTTHVLADLSTALSYIAIAAMLGYLAVKARSGLPFMWTFVAFGVFIIACGFTHALAVATVYTPLYWLAGGVKVVTAIASVGTALVLPPLLPRVLTMVESARLSEERREALVTSNRELEALTEQLRQLDQLKTQSFANVSHELRTPLALITGPVERLLDGGELTEGQRRDLEVVDRNAHVLLKHVNDLLDISKLEAGGMEMEYSEVDLSELLRLTASHFEVLAQERAIAFSVEAPPATPAQADPDKLQRVLSNLLSNAFKFTPDGGAVAVSLRTEGDAATIEVGDSGPGVKPGLREAIFERFRQAEGGSTRRFGGTGLGLAIAREFVGLHGGSITVGDSPAGGALFSVQLPLRAPAGVDVRPRAPERNGSPEIARHAAEELRPGSVAAGATSEDSGAPLVLVVEDNPEMNRFIAETLAGEYRVVSAHDGREGIEKAVELRPDLIISDIMMPGVSGDQLVREVRARPELDSVAVVMLTAKADDELRVRLLREGAQDYLAKPFSAEELRARAGNLIAMKRVRDILQRELESTSSDVGALAARLATRTREVEHALEARTQFLSIAAHELRTPTTMIKGYLQMVSASLSAESKADRRVARSLDVAQRQVERITALIDQMLDVTRIEGERLELHLQRFDLAEGVREVVDERAAARPDFDLAFEGPAAPLVVHADRERVRQVVQNLLSNAVRYANGSTRAEVSVEAEGSEAVVSVRDYGIGVPEEQRERIFEMYFRAANAGEHHGGLGLGLFISREIVERHGGRIWVDGAEGGGSVFRFALPLDGAEATRS